MGFFKRYSLAVSLVVFCLMTASPLQAGELPDGKKDRRGFFLGVGPGVGALNLSGGGINKTRASFLMDFRIGGGLTEKLLLLFNPNASLTRVSGKEFTIVNISGAVQYFAWKDLYLRPGLGFSQSSLSVKSGGSTITTESDLSFGADMAVGYEFRFGKRFAINPEAIYHYSRVTKSGAASANANVFGAQVGFLWYF